MARDAPVMAEEIFGPILPIVTVSGVDDAIAFISPPYTEGKKKFIRGMLRRLG